jgi:predicted GIY-YIG superfamily endonuclease
MFQGNGKERLYWLYVLLCKDEKYYVGVTSRSPAVRMTEHKIGKDSAYWTKRYPPIELAESKELGIMTYEEACKYENEKTLGLMKEKGINNVRGGTLRDVDDYEKRFGKLYLKEDWQVITVIGLLLLVILFLLLDRYILHPIH